MTGKSRLLAALKHFQGHALLWEMWNEPNIKQFWMPAPNAVDYSKLAIEVGKAIRSAAPQERYIGPATSRIDMPFLEVCFKAGLLKYWDAVSVHPYRRAKQDPESTAEEYAKLRAQE
jgi:polysaccharide biosynthesis protein PslG